ncbi:MAG: tetratricopeptide repeat protein, partial [Deferrisomatales bacterium]|nr:tetratricopeptide repeat protein [Deferrisomatales bacterium]
MTRKCRTRPWPIWFLVAALLLGGCSGPAEKRAKYFDKGMALYEQGEHVKAALEFKNALQVDPEFARGYLMLGKAQLAQRDIRQAYGAFLKAVELDPGQLDAQVALGQIFLGSGKVKEAREKADHVLAADPAHEDALLLKA